MDTMLRPPVLPEEKKLLLEMARKYAIRDAGPAGLPAHQFGQLAAALNEVAYQSPGQPIEVMVISDYLPRPQSPVMATALKTLMDSCYPAFISFTGPDHRGIHTATLHAIIV